MGPNEVMMWVQVGSTLVQLVTTSIDKVREFAATNGADDAKLRELDALYDARIAQAQREAEGPRT